MKDDPRMELIRPRGLLGGFWDTGDQRNILHRILDPGFEVESTDNGRRIFYTAHERMSWAPETDS